MRLLPTIALGPHLRGPVLVAILVVAAGCGSIAGASRASDTSPKTAASGAGATALGVPSGGTIAAAPLTGGGSAASGVGVAQAGTAIAYPYPGFVGTPGVAPDHTIVVTGTGRASLKTDLSDRVPAQRTALLAALADAKAQADAVASTVGVSISGVLSVSVSVGQGWFGPLPMGIEAPANGPTTVSPIAPLPNNAQPLSADLVVSVTVAYRIG